MDWLDTHTKELLRKVPDEKLAPAKTAEFALVLLRKGSDHKRMVEAIMAINRSSEAEAAVMAGRAAPFTVNPDLTEEEALWGQFELVCCDAVSVYLRSEVIEQNDRSYLWPLFDKISESSEFRPVTVTILQVPATESGDRFLEQFVAAQALQRTFPPDADDSV
jgi:hypothetical protein